MFTFKINYSYNIIHNCDLYIKLRHLIFSFVILASYPQLFFPSVTSTSNEGQLVVGREAYLPENRVNGIHKPIGTCKDKTETVSELFSTAYKFYQIKVRSNFLILSIFYKFKLSQMIFVRIWFSICSQSQNYQLLRYKATASNKSSGRQFFYTSVININNIVIFQQLGNYKV